MFAFTSLLAASAAVAGVLAAPASLQARAGPTDVEILNYALTLEHLENAFYSGALAKYDAHAFKKAGFPGWVRDRFAQIGQHEQSHVALLSSALGNAATKPCEYKFPYTDPKSFVALSAVLENGGVSAYLGAAASITEKAYLTVAGSILTTEARHQAWVSSAVAKGSAWSGAYDVPLDFDQIYSIVAPFFVSCPSTNPTLPVKAFPVATYAPASPAPGSKVTFTFEATKGPFFAAFYHGLTVDILPLAADKSVTVPKTLQGTVFAVITTNGTAVSDDTTVGGPAIFSFPFASYASNA